MIDIKEMKSNLNLNIMWNCLSGILDCGTIESSDTICIIIKVRLKTREFVKVDFVKIIYRLQQV